MKFYLSTVLSLSYLLVSCNLGLDSIKEKNDQGIIISSYQIDKDSLRQGQYLGYSDDGTLQEEANYSDDLLHGTRTIYYPDGKKEIEEQYDLGKLDGQYFNYHPNGQVSFEANYNQNILEGVTKKYYQNGALMEEVTFVQNEENGNFREYYENGNPKWQGTYLDGDNEIGELLHYSPKGELIKKLFCDSLHICKTIWTKEDGDINKE